MKKIFLLLTTYVLFLQLLQAQCTPNLSLSQHGEYCVGHDTLFLSGASNAASIIWAQNGIKIDTVSASPIKGEYFIGFGLGDLPEMLYHPEGIFIDNKGNLYVNNAGDTNIIKYSVDSIWPCNGQIVAGGNGWGSAPNQFNNANAIFVDTFGNLYVCDRGNNRIQKFPAGSNSSTNAITVAGGNGAGSATNQFNYPTGIFVTNNGYIYVSDYQNKRVMRFPPGSTSATNGVVIAGGNGFGLALNQIGPYGVFVDTGGYVYIGDAYGQRIMKFPPNSNSSTFGVIAAGGNGAGTGLNQISTPFGIALDSAQNIYVVDNSNHRIMKFPAGSSQSTYGTIVAGGNGSGYGSNQLKSPYYVVVNKQGEIFTENNIYNRVLKFPPNSTSATVSTIVAGGNGIDSNLNQFAHPFKAIVDKQGYVYVSDAGENARVLKFPPGSNYKTNGVIVAGGNGIGSAANQLSTPDGLFIDTAGNLYVADANNARIQKFPPGSNSATNGITVAGGNGTGAASTQFNLPSDVFVDLSGNLYVADYMNNRVQKFPPGSNSATIGSTVAGGNGLSSAPNGFRHPCYIFVDTAGYLFVSDEANNRIQRFPPNSLSSTNATTIVGNAYGNGPTQLQTPGGIFIDAQQCLYVADIGNYRIQKYPPGSNYGTTVAGGIYAPYGHSLYNYNGGAVWLDSAGTIFALEQTNKRVTKWRQPPYREPITDTSYLPLSIGTYTAIVNSFSGCADTISPAVTIVATLNSYISNSVCQGESYSFNGQQLGTAGNYFDTLTTQGGCDSIIHLSLSVANTYHLDIDTTILQGNSFTLPSGAVVTSGGVYNDTLQTSNGCDSTFTTTLNVVTGIQSAISNLQFAIFPNPATNTLHINTNLTGAVQYQIYNALGALVQTGKNTAPNFTADISSLSSGIYFLKLKTETAEAMRRFVKE